MSGFVFAIVVGLTVAVVVFSLLRTQRIREKYAATWIVLAAAAILVSIFPQVVGAVGRAVGVHTPINMVFVLAVVVLFVVLMQLSAEVSRAEETTRTLAERVALLQLEVTELRGAADRPDQPEDQA